MVNNQHTTVVKSNSQSSIVNSQSIVFFGSGNFVIPVVKKLLNHNLLLVVTNEKDENSKLISFCKSNNINLVSTNNPTQEMIDRHLSMVNGQSSIVNNSVAVLASFGAFIPDEIIRSFKNGIINIHPSLLPKYKGPSPVQYAILNGEIQTGVTLIKLDDQIDHGPILSQKPYNLTGNETTQELLNILFEIGAEMVEEQIIKLENGEKLSETPQKHSEESWSYRIEKKDGQIDPYNLQSTTYNLDNMIRAFYPWPTVWFRVPNVIPDSDPGSNSSVIAPARPPGGSKAKQSLPSPVIARSETTKQSNTARHSELVSGSNYNVIANEVMQSKLSGKIIKLLPEGKIQVEGKNPMSYKDFINGYEVEGKEILKKLDLRI